jgi:hypothetical protein
VGPMVDKPDPRYLWYLMAFKSGAKEPPLLLLLSGQM